MDLTWYALLIPLFFFLHKYCYYFSTSNNQNKLPPSPTKLPIIGNLHQLGTLPHRSLHKLSEKHGPVILLHLGSKPVLVASSVQAARDIMKTMISYAQTDLNLVWLIDSFMALRTSALVPMVSTGDKLKALSCFTFSATKESNLIVISEKKNMIEKIRQECDSSSSVIDLRDHFCFLTGNIISRVALGRIYNERESGIDAKAILAEFVQLLGTFNVGDYIPWLEWVNKITGLNTKVENVAKKLDTFLERVMEEHIIRNKKEEYSTGEAKDFVDVLLEIQNGKETGFPLQRDSLKAILLNIFAAGVDTTLEWIMAELLRAMETLQNEVRGLAQGKTE